MIETRRLMLVALAVAFFCGTAALAADLPGTGDDAGKTVVYRDTWGVPHIYAPTVQAAMYAMGWAQAQDRPEQLLRNFLLGMGELASVDGAGAVRTDQASRIFAHYRKAKELADKELSPELKQNLEAFVAGVTDFYEAHPDDVPEWWGGREFDIYMVIAFGRIFLYGWSIDDGFGDLKRGGVQPGFDQVYRSSNQFSVAPSRSAEGAAILLIDPHLSWFGPSRFWEFRVHAGPWHGSGFTLAGFPYIGLGHNADVGWAMTTGGPDTADVYELDLNDAKPPQYRYEGEWRDFEVRLERIEVNGADTVELPIYSSVHGPVAAMREGKAYVVKTAYMDCVRGLEAWHLFNMAKDYTGVVAGLDTQQVFPQNVMVADTSGNIYYHRTGRVPKRPQGYDWSKPVPGGTAATQWQGLLPQSELVHILNPSQGYMQNCNIPPHAMMVDSPLTSGKYLDYAYSDAGYNGHGVWTNNRGARAVQLLMNDGSVTAEEARAYANDAMPFGTDRWIKALLEADDAVGGVYDDNSAYQAALEELRAWRSGPHALELHRASAAALKYYYWREQVAKTREGRDIDDAIDQHYRIVQSTAEFTEPELTSAQERVMLAALVDALEELDAEFGLEAVYGDKFRVGRDDESWPCGGGGDYGTRTVRSVSYSGERDDHTRWGRGGQTSTQIVVFTRPVQSWSQPPIGQSDRADSPHYDDQAETLFSERRFKDTWWMPEELQAHISGRVVLDGAP